MAVVLDRSGGFRRFGDDEVPSQQKNSTRVRQLNNQLEVFLTREPLPALIHADEMRRGESDRQSDLLAGHPATHQFCYGFHGKQRNTPFRLPQRTVAFPVVTVRYNLTCLKPCDGTMFV